MLNVLVITLADDRATVLGMSADSPLQLIQRAAVHESQTVEDAIQHIKTNWPNVILVESNLIMRSEDTSKTLLHELIGRTRGGCTTIFTGYFFHLLSKVSRKGLEALLADHFELKWKLVKSDDVITDLVVPDLNMLRTTNLAPTIQTRAVFLKNVSKEEAVYRARQQPESLASVAFARVGSGKVGYIGGLGNGVEAARIILAMCGLDRLEDAPMPPDTAEQSLLRRNMFCKLYF